jgi:glycosyltransferase involved in cell wall biosynthesis
MLAIRALLWDASRRADRIAVQLPWMREALVSQLGADAERVIVVGTTSRDSLAGGPSRHVDASGRELKDAVLYVGSADSHKNHRVLGPAMSKLRQARPDVRLFATLPAGYVDESEGIVCLDHLDDQALSAAYSAAAVLVFPSLVESAGLPLIEGMSFGVPVVVADRPYAHDMCGDAALYFDPNDAAGLAARLLELLESSALRERLRGAGLRRAQAFHLARPYERLIHLAASLDDIRNPRG